MAEKKRRNTVAQRAKAVEVSGHWARLFMGLKYSSQEFYARVEQVLAERALPDIRVSRVDWKEGGPLSSRREYLRIQRERLVFDICGAPFGTGFFISIWSGERPFRIGVLILCAALIAAVALVFWTDEPPFYFYRFMYEKFGFRSYILRPVMISILFIATLVLIVRAGPNLDAVLIRIPAIGYLYEKYFRKITYYRFDRQCMYQQAVHQAVMQVIDELVKVQGIEPMSEFERRPLFPDPFLSKGYNGHR